MDIYLHLHSVHGNSNDREHTGWFDVEEFCHGDTNLVNNSGDHQSPMRNINVVTLWLNPTHADLVLLRHYYQGTVFSKALVDIRPARKKMPNQKILIEFGSAMISSLVHRLMLPNNVPRLRLVLSGGTMAATST